MYQDCCGGHIIDKQGQGCCKNKPFNLESHDCCDGDITDASIFPGKSRKISFFLWSPFELLIKFSKESMNSRYQLGCTVNVNVLWYLKRSLFYKLPYYNRK